MLFFQRHQNLVAGKQCRPIKTSQVWPDAQDTGAVGGGTSLLYKVPVKLVDNGMIGMVSSLGWIP